MMPHWSGLTLVLVLLLIPLRVSAGELKIVDTRGLIRATREIKKPVSVVVQPEAKAAESGVSLVNTDGLATDITATVQDGRYVFQSVRQGTWQIQATEPLQIRSVRIQE